MGWMCTLQDKELSELLVLNPHYREDEVSIECGVKAFHALNEDFTPLRRVFAEKAGDKPIRLSWRISGQRMGGTKLFAISMVGNVAKLRIHRDSAGIFYDYAEVRGVADKLLQSGNFERVIIHEEIMVEATCD